MIFRYEKNNFSDRVTMYNDVRKNIYCEDGIISFGDDEEKNMVKVSELFDVYVGIVSGKDEVYKNEEFGNIDVLNGEDKVDKYIFVENYPTGDTKLDKYLLENKDNLINRRIKKFNDNNWYEWGAPRNIKIIRKNKGKKCLFIKCLSRQDKICFKDNVQYFGGSLLMMIPKKENIDLDYIETYINSKEFKDNFMYSGRFKIGHRCLSNSFINFSY
jgi:adenine-specific DNA-methyltransferase